MEHERPGYYAIIPADVRYDDRIPANAKLLYGEISALIGKDGFCFASNEYFSQVYQMTPENISRLISKLEEAGHIIREMVYDRSGQIVMRKLYLRVSIPDVQGIDKKINTPQQNNHEGIDKKIKDTNTSNTNIPPLIPPEGGEGKIQKKKSRSKDYKAQANTLPERFEKFWTFYRNHVPPDRTAGSRQEAIKAWDKLAPSNELATAMALSLAKQVNSQAWARGVGIPYASTWLNRHGWEDDWGPSADSAAGRPEDTGSEEAAEWVN